MDGRWPSGPVQGQIRVVGAVLLSPVLASTSPRSEYMGPRSALNLLLHFGYPRHTRDLTTAAGSVGQSYSPYMQAQLIFAAKDVPKKHNIPFAIFFAKSVHFKSAWGFHRPVQAKV